MKLASARSSFAPKSQYTAKRAPESFVARLRSRMPSCSPSSQCGLGLKSNLGGAPQRRTSTLSSVVFPAGTLWWGRLGMPARISRTRASSSAATFSNCWICSRNCLVSDIWTVASCPLFFSFAISSDARLRRALVISASLMAWRRCVSTSWKSFNTSPGSIPRSRSFSSTRGKLSRTKLRSSMGVNYCTQKRREVHVDGADCTSETLVHPMGNSIPSHLVRRVTGCKLPRNAILCSLRGPGISTVSWPHRRRPRLRLQRAPQTRGYRRHRSISRRLPGALPRSVGRRRLSSSARTGADFTDCNYNYANTRTAPGHSTLLTGAYSNGHGIMANEWWDPQKKKMVTSVEDDGTKLVGIASSGPGASPHNLLADTLGDELKLATQGKARVFAVALKDRAAILPAGFAGNG